MRTRSETNPKARARPWTAPAIVVVTPIGLALFAMSILASCFCSANRAAPEAREALAVCHDAIAGDWMFEMKMGGREPIAAKLHFSVTGGILAGSMLAADGDTQELQNIALKGNKIFWDVENRYGAQHAEGVVKGSSMEGTIKITRRRDADWDGGPVRGGRPGGGVGRWGDGRSGSGGRRGDGQTPKITWTAFKSTPPASD